MVNETPIQTDARARVEKIREDLGFPRKEVWESLDAVQRQEWTRILRIKDSIISSSVKTLAKNLYTSKARFVFELLQNAEDNHYEEARGRGEAPYVSFHVYPHKIVQECNEDGFTEDNLKAICAVGQSSKHGAQGYVGEKGIGFKSVFMAAYRVHIQSRGLSFFFEHRESDTGLGMITPEWQDLQEDLEEQLTRITLLLHDEGDEDVLARQRGRIRAQFAEIHDTILLFLKKLSKIVVVFHDDEDDEAKVTKSITFTINREEADCRVLTKRTTENGNTTEDIKYYHITQQLVNNLAGNENRTYTEKEHASRAYATSEVTLAFPLTRDHVPVLNDEWIFAFLPVQKTRFKFLIQADFVTQANRQGIVVDSARNEGLSDGIANTFIVAIKQMCRHPTLRFQWMRYLPKRDDTIDSYWSHLVTQITQKLQQATVMVPRPFALSRGTLKLIKDSAILAPSMLDSSGEPLLRDIDPRIYLSSAYLQSDLHLLADLGLRLMAMSEIIDRAKWDLAQGHSSIKSIEDQDWQSRMALLLRLPFSNQRRDLRHMQDEIRALDLLPLRTGKWRARPRFSRDVYYSKVSGTNLEIPVDLDLDVISPSAVANKERKELFDSIGVMNASVADVRSSISALYRRRLPILTVAPAVDHLHFLYLTHHQVEASDDYSAIKIVSHELRLMTPSRYNDIYVRDESPYGPGQLLDTTPAGNLLGDGAPGLEVRYVHECYLKNVPGPPTDDMVTFKEWLHKYFNVRRYIPVADAEGKKLSDACRYIATHRPEKFLGFLKETWADESRRFHRGGDFLRQLGKVMVLCGRGGETSMCELENTYLPLDALRGLCDRFLLDDEPFPLLKLEEPLSNGVFPLEWKEIDMVFDLGLIGLDLVDFALDLLQTIRLYNDNPSSLGTPKRLLDLYIFLQGKILESGDQSETEDRIKSFFANGNDYIYIPQNGSRLAKWASPEDCVWQAPTGANTITKNSLSHLYSHHFRIEAAQLNDFFLKTLEVHRKCSWENIVDEIKALKSGEYDDLDVIHRLYKYLHSLNLGPISKGVLRNVFMNENLIYGGEVNKWYTTRQCLWSSPTNIRAMLVVQPLYEDLEDFFVNLLGVETKTAKMVYEKLKGEETARLPMEEIKDTILAFNSLLASESDAFDPEPVLQNKVFPVRLPEGGERVLQNGKEGFSIWDRKPLGDDFSEQAKFLDFGMDQVRHLENFIRIAVTYDSPRVGDTDSEEALYRYLRGSETLETNKITSELHLHQDGRVIKVEKEASLLHIREDDAGLKIYIPEDEVNQETCFRSKLPQRLCEWLMTDPATQISDPVPAEAVMVVQGALGAGRPSLRAILDEQGILDIDLVDEEDDGGDDGTARITPPISRGWIDDLRDRLTSGNSATEMATPSSTNSSPGLNPSYHGGARESPAATNGRASVSSSVASSTPIIIPVQPSLSGYTRMLLLIVAQAREGVFPSPAGPLNIPVRLQHDVLGRNPYSLQDFGKLERDKMVGAAGELFVFELLSCLRNPALPRFSRENWKSTIRHYVASHPEYEDIGQFFGPETSDITYDDTDGVLTNLLIDKGYMPAHVGAAARIKYSIEIKTTSDTCDTPFFMSNAQYIMMQRQGIDNASLQLPDRLYVIFRVYNIGRSSIGVRVLVDPEHMRQIGTLEFTANTWSVVVKD